MFSLTLMIVAAGALAACTTTEKTLSGAGVGAVAGALIGGFGTYLFETADGRCQYRNSRGHIYTTRCHWK
ncbi:hypothetical protein E0D97_07210 [Oricola cellulosilytica]|uniref:Glycine zipper 2TM domain-containing protein n=2 Tax=Oricola cellulosilytica TaxID=1429082 RepID=A0A4R0PFS4_9HYPH|nr:hypothetical protein E0D97_07210 [Oricola cellulosilytica]